MHAEQTMGGQHGTRIGNSGLVLNEHRLPSFRRPNIAFASILLSAPLAIATFVALLLGGHSLIAALLIGWAMQILVFSIGLVAGLLQQAQPALPLALPSQRDATPPEAA